MTRDSEAQLLDFCTRQHGAFQESAWLEAQMVPHDEKVAACLFLSGTDWYGYSDRLLGLAEKLSPGCSDKVGDILRGLRFDCLRFSTLLRRELRHA